MWPFSTRRVLPLITHIFKNDEIRRQAPGTNLQDLGYLGHDLKNRRSCLLAYFGNTVGSELGT